MTTKGDNADVEAKRLKAFIADLLSVSAIQVISGGREPLQIIGALLEVLLGTLRLDLAFAEFKVSSPGALAELVRFSKLSTLNEVRPEIRAAVDTWLETPPQTSPSVVRCRTVVGDFSLALVRLGLHAQVGLLVACSRREDFPTQTERLLLGVAANQAVTGIQQAILLSRQQSLAQELERKVGQRTKELQAANIELVNALKQIDGLRSGLQRENLQLRENAAGFHGGLAPWQMRRAEQLMNENLGVQVPLSRLAEQCGLSVRHFARAFRESTGVPPHRWRTNRRVERAKELLLSSGLSLSEVALACGFGNQSHFTRVFSATVCMSPGLWRRLQGTSLSAVDGVLRTNSRSSEGDTRLKSTRSTAMEGPNNRKVQ